MFFKKKDQRNIDEILTPKDNKKQENDCLEDDKNSEYFEEGENELTDTALKCFGWKEDKTEKWLVKCARFWYGIMSFIWFLFGATTFAPIIFISNKIDVIFNDRKKSILFAIIIHTVLIALIVSLFVINRQPVEVTTS